MAICIPINTIYTYTIRKSYSPLFKHTDQRIEDIFVKQKVGRYTGSRWLIHSAKHHKNNQSQRLKHLYRLSWLVMRVGVGETPMLGPYKYINTWIAKVPSPGLERKGRSHSRSYFFQDVTVISPNTTIISRLNYMDGTYLNGMECGYWNDLHVLMAAGIFVMSTCDVSWLHK